MRESYAQKQIPAEGKDAVPYPGWREIVQLLGLHGVEAFVGEVLGAGGVGGVLENIPFEPAVILVSEATGPLLQVQLPGSAAKVDINMITGAAAAVAIPDATLEADGLYDLALPVTIVPDADTASVLILGFRDSNGSI